MRNIALAVATTALFAASAHAQTTAKPSWYLSGGIGYAKTTESASDSASLIVHSATNSNFQYKGSNTSAKVALGFNFDRHFALEGSFVDFGKFSARRDVTAPTTATVDANWKVYGFGIGLRAAWPVTDKFSIYGKVGTARITSDYKFSETITPSDRSEKGNRWALFYGAGMEYDITPRVGVRAEWELYKNATNTNVINIGGDAFDYNTFFGSVYFRF